MAGTLLLFFELKNSGRDLRSMGWIVERLNQVLYEGMMTGCVWDAR
jgi:hypothetical protein